MAPRQHKQVLELLMSLKGLNQENFFEDKILTIRHPQTHFGATESDYLIRRSKTPCKCLRTAAAFQQNSALALVMISVSFGCII